MRHAISIRALARSMGIDEKTIRHAIRRGRIPERALVRSDGGRVAGIADPRLAAESWERNTPPQRGGRGGVPADVPLEVRQARARRDEVHRVLQQARAADLINRGAKHKREFVRRDAVGAALVLAAKRVLDQIPSDRRRNARNLLASFEREFKREIE
jgi:hypothetical protein